MAKNKVITAERGERMRTGRGYALTTPSGKTFKVTLIKRFKIGDESGAILRILPTPK